MSSKQTNNLFISTSISENFTALESIPSLRGYYRLLTQALSNCRINRIESIEYTGRLLASLAHKARLTRRMDVVEQVSQLMLALPLSKQLKGIAFFYQATLKWQQGDSKNTRRLLEQAAEKATPQYRARALQCIGATYYERGALDAALPFYLAAGRYAIDYDPLTVAQSQWMIAIIRSIHGDHRRAVDDLENLFPLIHTISKQHPAIYYDYLNSLAVEFGEVGRIAEAESAISIALSSPFASAYPEWSKTREEIEQKRNYPDPSRCFLDRSITESEANTSLSATIERQAEAAISPQPQSRVETKPLREVAFYRFVELITCQITITLPNAALLFIPGGVAKSFLQRLGRSVQLRGPPTSFLF